MPSGLRIEKGVDRGRPVRFRFDGREIAAYDGETLAVALLAAGVRALRHGPNDAGPRGLFCGMGICQECVVLVGGRRVESCRVQVRDGLDVGAAP